MRKQTLWNCDASSVLLLCACLPRQHCPADICIICEQWLLTYPQAMYGSTKRSMFNEALFSFTKTPLWIWRNRRSCKTLRTLGWTPLILDKDKTQKVTWLKCELRNMFLITKTGKRKRSWFFSTWQKKNFTTREMSKAKTCTPKLANGDAVHTKKQGQTTEAITNDTHPLIRITKANFGSSGTK